MNALATRARNVGYEQLVGPLSLRNTPEQVIVEQLQEAGRQVKHGQVATLLLAPEDLEQVGPDGMAELAEEVDEQLWNVGYRPPPGEQVMTYVDEHGVIHVQLMERSPDMALLAPLLLVGLAGLPLLFFLFKNNEEAQPAKQPQSLGNGGLKKMLPFIILGAVVVGGLVLVMVTQRRALPKGS